MSSVALGVPIPVTPEGSWGACWALLIAGTVLGQRDRLPSPPPVLTTRGGTSPTSPASPSSCQALAHAFLPVLAPFLPIVGDGFLHGLRCFVQPTPSLMSQVLLNLRNSCWRAEVDVGCLPA